VAVDVPVDTDKRTLYGEWLRNSRWRDKVHKQATLKALDMPEDEMSVSVQQGMTWKELAVIAALVVGIGGVALSLATKPAPAPPPPVPAIQPAEDLADRDYEIRFFDADGKPVNVKPLTPDP